MTDAERNELVEKLSDLCAKNFPDEGKPIDFKEVSSDWVQSIESLGYEIVKKIKPGDTVTLSTGDDLIVR